MVKLVSLSVCSVKSLAPARCKAPDILLVGESFAKSFRAFEKEQAGLLCFSENFSALGRYQGHPPQSPRPLCPPCWPSPAPCCRQLPRGW